MDFFIYKHYAICDESKRKIERERERENVKCGKKSNDNIFGFIFFFRFSLSLSFRRSKQRNLHWKLYDVGVVVVAVDGEVVTFVHWPIRCLPNRIHLFFLSLHNRPVSFSRFLSVSSLPLSIHVDVFITYIHTHTYIYIYIYMKARSNTHTNVGTNRNEALRNVLDNEMANHWNSANSIIDFRFEFI